jgi:2-isopropylmalate synthase
VHAEVGPHSHGHLDGLPESVDVYDTTLRDGTQQEGMSLTVEDKLRVAEQLDHLGVAFIEGGWPGANPKDEEFFARASSELHLGHPRRFRLDPETAGRRR